MRRKQVVVQKANAAAAGSGNTKNNGASGADISNYAGMIKSAIESKFYMDPSFTGKVCTLRIKLGPDGTLKDIQSEGGDPALCQAALAAARRAKFLSHQAVRFTKCLKMRHWTLNLSNVFSCKEKIRAKLYQCVK